MKKMLATWAVAVVALGCAGSLRAHHSGSMYETTPVWVRGTVVRFESVNPHTITTLESRSEDGQVSRWAVEGPAPFQLDRIGFGLTVPAIGEVVEFCAFPYKPPAELSRMFPEAEFPVRRLSSDADGVTPQFVAGHVMVMADGEKRMWEPHGRISECVRSSDEPRQSWLDFLNEDATARQAWCQQRGTESVQSIVSLREFIEEINDSIAVPCQ